MARVVVRGVGEFGSAVAHRLFAAGHLVVLHDAPRPDACHRLMAFTDAVFDGEAQLDGVTARCLPDLRSIDAVLTARKVVPVTVADLEDVLAAIRPDVLVDARMRKRSQPEAQRLLAPLTIGIGPGFIAGETTDLAVETGFGDDFARVLDRGVTRALAGEPPPVEGHGRDRFIYAPADGVFHTSLHPRATVAAGDELGRLNSTPLYARFGGALRGLTHDDVPVVAGTRLIEVDPRGPDAITGGIGPRQARIADVVLRVVERRGEFGAAAGS